MPVATVVNHTLVRVKKARLALVVKITEQKKLRLKKILKLRGQGEEVRKSYLAISVLHFFWWI